MFRMYFLLILLLGGCATVVSGTTQRITVITQEVEGASCELLDNGGQFWFLKETPGVVEVRKGKGPLSITCSKEGYKKNTTVLKEKVIAATAGNTGALLVFPPAAIAGFAVDAVTGAAEKYPDKVEIWLEPLYFNTEYERRIWQEKRDFAMKVPGSISNKYKKASKYYTPTYEERQELYDYHRQYVPTGGGSYYTAD